MFIANAEWTNRGVGVLRFRFEVGRSAASLCCDYNPAIKKVIFSQFIVRHRVNSQKRIGIAAF